MTAADDETGRVRSYLVSQAAKLSLPELVEKIRRDTVSLREAGESVPSACFNQRPGPHDWSAAEVYTHILDMNERGARAIEGILDHGVPPAPIADEMSAAMRTDLHAAEDHWRVYSTRREHLYARVLRASGNEHLDVSIVHRQFGALNWRQWLLFMRVHDLDHLRQLQALARHFAASSGGPRTHGRQ